MRINNHDNVKELFKHPYGGSLQSTHPQLQFLRIFLFSFNWSYPCKQHLHGKIHLKRSQYIMKYLVIVSFRTKRYSCLLTVPCDVSFQSSSITDVTEFSSSALSSCTINDFLWHKRCFWGTIESSWKWHGKEFILLLIQFFFYFLIYKISLTISSSWRWRGSWIERVGKNNWKA